MVQSEADAQGKHVGSVRLWLYGVAALIVLMIVVGGATRLTESGLSITEWKPVTGTLPPLSEAAWQAEFDKYKTIPQYEILNKGMGLEAFKQIFWWEWAHRLLGRVIGLAFLLPYLYFLARGAIRGRLAVQCLGLFLLGGLQGAIGWWMVASGLSERTSVSQYRLAIHLTLACLILAAIVAVARGLTPARSLAADTGLRRGALAILGLVLVQIFAGGLVAGLDAGMTFNTWPLMDGALVPALDKLGLLAPAWRNLFENVMMVQFQHRMIAYALWLAVLVHMLRSVRHGGAAASQSVLLFALVSGQAALGILTLVLVVPLDIALAHQFGAAVVLIAATLHAVDLVRAGARTAPAPASGGVPQASA
ncbi:COX15/CtaA family protein [Aquabacter spiritensis]|uniref:Heme A synthase n=1 Tax=Aquabacter spiritensis TaxID=933073 RepID=A0A4R3LLV2_9HYPH|nr:COX15/CtaA family protein [Aquabacter spiritensis]TCT00951.1 cytochrome c oxidase assembly protein subunit 15 [Aquabacter spiritensis]